MAVLFIGPDVNHLVPLPDPKRGGLTVRLQDIDSGSTTRTADGTMIRDRVVGGDDAKRKLEIEWPPLNTLGAKEVLQAVKDVFFYVKYPDPYTGAFRTAQFYVGDREAPVYSADPGGTEILWESIKYDLIEK